MIKPTVRFKTFKPFKPGHLVLLSDTGRMEGEGWNYWNLWNDWNGEA
jgi:hypothetical protein